ncbi:uncharacterized protein [Triticum aestivum]|uniref:uncharacterized protein isoform X3 n=1 Tax=Triticum aestivum TaxID=4565 RepID=UPI001D02F427|nr:uncharacterized protein LOC123059893 isoform X3 [Triticum aestivum]
MSTISDQKKRTLEAIQQRYAAAKAKKLQDEQPKCPKNKESTPKPKFDARRKGKTPESTPRTSGQLPTFRAQGNSSHQQKPSASSGKPICVCACDFVLKLTDSFFDLLGGEINPIYSEISFALHENLSQDDYANPDSTDVVQSVIYDIIQKGGEAGKISKGSKKLKLDRGILLDNYVQKGPILVDAQSRSLLIHSKRSKRHMSLKQHKKCGSFDLHDTFRRFDLYKPMHEMWKDYMRELTKSTPFDAVSKTEPSQKRYLYGNLLSVGTRLLEKAIVGKPPFSRSSWGAYNSGTMQSSLISRCKWHHDS